VVQWRHGLVLITWGGAGQLAGRETGGGGETTTRGGGTSVFRGRKKKLWVDLVVKSEKHSGLIVK
jgi:hypothetical protein